MLAEGALSVLVPLVGFLLIAESMIDIIVRGARERGNLERRSPSEDSFFMFFRRRLRRWRGL